jgi:hypothetical protein
MATCGKFNFREWPQVFGRTGISLLMLAAAGGHAELVADLLKKKSMAPDLDGNRRRVRKNQRFFFEQSIELINLGEIQCYLTTDPYRRHEVATGTLLL